MKNVKHPLLHIILSSALVLSGCGGSSELSNNSQILTPESKNTLFTPSNSSIIDQIDEKTSKEIAKLEKEIKKRREERVEKVLGYLKKQNDFIEFKNPLLEILDDDRKRIFVEVYYKNQMYPTEFISPADHPESFWMEKVSGFDLEEITLQGLCIDLSKCSEFAVEFAFKRPGKKIVSQCVFHIPDNRQQNNTIKPAKDHGNCSENTTQPKKSSSVNEEPANKEPINREVKPEQQEPPVINVDIAPKDKSEISAKKEEDSSIHIEIDKSDKKDPVTDSSVEQPESATTSPVPRPKPRPKNLMERYNNQQDTATEEDSTPSAISQEEESEPLSPSPEESNLEQEDSLPNGETLTVEIEREEEDTTASELSLNSSSRPKARPKNLTQQEPENLEQEDSLSNGETLTVEIEKEEEDTTASKLSLNSSSRPKARSTNLTQQKPENLEEEDSLSNGETLTVEIGREEEDTTASELSLNSSSRPKTRPTLTQQKNEEETTQKEDENLETEEEGDASEALLIVGAGDIMFPNINDSDSDSDLAVVSADTGEILNETDDPDFKGDPLLERIATYVYHQARGFYTNGSIDHSTQLESSIPGAKINPDRRNRQYGSGITTDIFTYTANMFQNKYPDSPICINNISKKNGGRVNGTSVSHQNGLDMDISLPSTSNPCTGSSYFKNWNSLDSDPEFYAKNLEFLQILLSTKRIHAILVDKGFIRNLCTYVKTKTNLNKEERASIFKKLNHWEGHRNHYHVRIQCSKKQNPGCHQQGELKGSTCS